MEDKFVQFGYDALAIFIPVLVALAVEYVRRRLGTEKLRKIQEELATKQDLAILAVRFVEQVYKELEGPAKYQKAAEWLAARANEHGIRITTDEVKGLIEAALREMKDAFGEEWAKVSEA